MNKILALILHSAEQVAVVATGPIGAVVDSSAHSIFDKDSKTPKDEAIIDTIANGIELVEQLKGVDIANEPQFRTACLGLDYNLKLLRDSLRPVSTGSTDKMNTTSVVPISDNKDLG